MPARDSAPASVRAAPRPDLLTYAAFGLLVLLISGNTIAVRYTNRALPPFWGAGTRFTAAALIFFAVVALKRYPLPRGRALLGSVIYGVLQFGLGYALGYRALLHLTAGLFAVILATGPILTLFYAVLARVESFRLQTLLGAVIAVAGIALILLEGAGIRVPLGSALLALGMAMSFALASVVVKASQPVNNAAMNAVGMAVGAPILLLLSLIFGEKATLPADLSTWLAQGYLVVGGGVGLFMVMLFLLKRWTATAVSYQSVLSPIATILFSAWLLGEHLSAWLLAGGVLVLGGVYLGVLMPRWGAGKVAQPAERSLEVLNVDGCIAMPGSPECSP
ncbi:MAG: DMT family transporter [Anaerolineae bacterium]